MHGQHTGTDAFILHQPTSLFFLLPARPPALLVRKTIMWAAGRVGPVQLQLLLSGTSARCFSDAAATAAAAAEAETYYQRLDVSRHATVDEIKAAFRKRAKT